MSGGFLASLWNVIDSTQAVVPEIMLGVAPESISTSKVEMWLYNHYSVGVT
jgi:hypothetical protein